MLTRASFFITDIVFLESVRCNFELLFMKIARLFLTTRSPTMVFLFIENWVHHIYDIYGNSGGGKGLWAFYDLP